VGAPMPGLRTSVALLLPMLACVSARAEDITVRLPEHSPCPSEQILGALATRLGQSELRVSEVAAKDEVMLSLTFSKGRWGIEIIAPGQLPLTRTLEVREGDCLALSEASALIAERYLESIDWKSAPGEVRRLPPPPRWQARLAVRDQGLRCRRLLLRRGVGPDLRSGGQGLLL